MQRVIFLMAMLVCATVGSAAAEELTLTSPAFEPGGRLLRKFTCEGPGISPPLEIGNVPEGTRSLALIVEDPDAPMGNWVHWVVWNIHPRTHILPEGRVPRGARQGMSDFRSQSYGGPCPPDGEHRYFFRLYALDTRLKLERDTDKDGLIKAMEGHILEQAELMGRYERNRD
jgi:Raf kinase inhibitor-like YbhB/YbcL family protein